ncbi:hypothetical protein SprV_0100213400 [Sparganum proliferum]
MADARLLEELDEFVTRPDILIMGDFNAPHIDWSSTHANSSEQTFDGSFLNTTLKLFLTQHLMLPTRVREGQQANCLDLVLTKSQDSINEVLCLPHLVSCNSPSEGGVADAMQRLHNSKASGEDGISTEIYKSCVDTLASWLHEVIGQAWRNEVAPDDWGLGLLVPILKKGDKRRCENCRNVGHIGVAAKIFVIALLRRFQAARDSRTWPNPAGCRDGCRRSDQVFTEAHSRIPPWLQQLTVVCFVDFAAVSDSVRPQSLWQIMALDGVLPKIIAMTKSTILVSTLWRPGSMSYAIDWIFGRTLHDGGGVEFAAGHRLTGPDYIDDTTLLASSSGDLQCMMSRVNKVAK